MIGETAPQSLGKPRAHIDLAKRRYSVLLTGVGGQGVLTAAKILGTAASHAGVPMAVGQLHGMTQRGGSIQCPVLFGPGRSCFISGTADVVVAFEAMEALGAMKEIGAETRVIVNRGAIMPFEATRAKIAYPAIDDVVKEVGTATSSVYDVDGYDLIAPLGERRVLNIFMLGLLSGIGQLPFDDKVLWGAVSSHAPARFSEVNHEAFSMGLKWARKQAC